MHKRNSLLASLQEIDQELDSAPAVKMLMHIICQNLLRYGNNPYNIIPRNIFFAQSCRNVYVGYSIGESIVGVERRKKIIGYFSACLKGFIDFYSISETKKIANVNSQSKVNYKRN